MIDPYYICISQQLDIIVTDFAEPNVKLLSMNGKQSNKELNYGEYGVAPRQGLLQPYGCCQDMYGIIMIADNRNDKVYMCMCICSYLLQMSIVLVGWGNSIFSIDADKLV